jgi:molecular chaperone GrpE
MKNEKLNEETAKSQPDREQKNKSKKISGKDDKHSEELKKKIREAETKLAEVQDKHLRLSAEFDNYRKRTLKEKIDLLKTAGEESLGRIIPVMDDFERAMNHIDEAKEIIPVKDGILLIYNKFKDILAQQGVKEIDAIHQEFNTDLHEAITKIPAPDQNLKGKVLEVVQKGYYLNDKVIRFAKVIVGE